MVKKVSQKKRPQFFRSFREASLNIVAVCLALLPLVFVSLWTRGSVSQVLANTDSRKVLTQQVLAKGSTPQLFSEPLVSVTFDDGWETMYTNGLPLLEKYGIRTTQYILPGEFNDQLYLSKAQANSMKKAGHEIASHTVDHKNLTTLTNADVLYELQTSRQMLQKENLVSQNHVNFAAPNGAVNDSILQNVRTFYASHRNTLGDITNGISDVDVNVGPVLPRYNIIAYAVRQNTTVDQIQQALEYAKQHNGWFVLVYHQIDDSNELYSVSANTLDKQLQTIAQSHVKVVTVDDVVATHPREQ